MLLKLFDESGQLVCSMSDNDKQLMNYSPYDYYTIHIIDMDPTTINFDNLEDVPKYEISEESYNSRNDTFRKFKEEQMKKNPDLMKPKKQVEDNYLEQEAMEIQVGNRCKVNPGEKRGTVRYVGKVPEAQPGYFLGVELDEPLGKNDGSIKGTRYFECQPSFGVFVRPNAVEVGDFKPYDEDPDEI